MPNILLKIKWSPFRFARLLFVGLWLLLGVGLSSLWAQSFEVSFLTGQWQPQTLTPQNATSLFAGSAETSPFFQVRLCEPVRNGLFLGQALGIWHQKSVADAEVKSLSLVPVDFFLKHRLVTNALIMPFVCYGGGAVLALRASRNPSVGLPPRVGVDIFVETGIDLRLRESLGFHLSFAYHYTKFQQAVGETDDFTGPQGMLGVFWQF